MTTQSPPTVQVKMPSTTSNEGALVILRRHRLHDIYVHVPRGTSHFRTVNINSQELSRSEEFKIDPLNDDKVQISIGDIRFNGEVIPKPKGHPSLD